MSFLGKFSSFFENQEMDDDCVLALDIGSKYIKTLVFKSEGEDSPKAIVLGCGKAEIGQAKAQEEKLGKISRACVLAKREAENMAGEKTSQAIFGLNGQYAKCSTNTFSYLRGKSARAIDLVETRNLIQKAQWRVFENIREKESLETGLLETEIKLIKGKVIDVRIDGYSVVDPVGFHGKEISFCILNEFSFIDKIKFFQHLKAEMNLKKISLVSLPNAILGSVALNIFKSNSLGAVSCILVDCGYEATNISIIEKGILYGPKIVNFGNKVFLKRLGTKLDLSLKEVEEVEKKYCQGDLSPNIKRKITDILKNDFEVWLEGIKQVLREFSNFDSLPSQFLLVGGGSLLPGIKKILEKSDWQEDFNFLQSVKAKIIKPLEIEAVEDKANSFYNFGYIPALSLASYCVRSLKKESTVNEVLEKVIRLMQT